MTDIDTMINRLSDRQRLEFAVWCAERVRHLMTDPRSTAALDVAARHLRGEATDQELNAAWAAAATAWDAAWAAGAAAAAAAWNAAWDVERAAQRAELERMIAEVKP